MQLKGIPSNIELCKAILASEKFAGGMTTTGFLVDFPFSPAAVEVTAPGMNTTVQVAPPPAAGLTVPRVTSALVSSRLDAEHRSPRAADLLCTWERLVALPKDVSLQLIFILIWLGMFRVQGMSWKHI